MITLEDFRRIDLRVALVLSAERVEHTQKLLKVTVSLGEEQRTLIAGLGASYNPEDLIGLKLIMVANMEPAVIRGIQSNGMLLGVGCDGASIALVTLNKDAAPGTPVQ